MAQEYLTTPINKIQKEKRKGYAVKLGYIAISIAALILTWWALAVVFDKSYFPTPPEVFEALIQSFDNVPGIGLSMSTQLFSSLERFVFGFLLARVTAVPVGLLLGHSKRAEMLFTPAIEVIRPIPPMAWVPLFFLAFGVFLGPVLTIFIGAFFPILSNVVFGVKSVDKNLIDASKTFGASKLQTFSKVIFPSTIPHMMTGISVGLGIGWMCIVSAEMIGAKGGGLGFIIQSCYNLGLYDFMFAGMVMIGILGILTALLGKFIENEVARWMGMK